jgi:hypothetical protein
MDPNANLAEQLRLAALLVDDMWNLPLREQQDNAARLAELVRSLDGWLKGGGFLPAPWARGPNGVRL